MPKPKGKPVSQAEFKWLVHEQMGLTVCSPLTLMLCSTPWSQGRQHRNPCGETIHESVDGFADDKILLVVSWLSSHIVVAKTSNSSIEDKTQEYSDASAALYEVTGKRKYVLSSDSGKIKRAVQTIKGSSPVISFGDADFSLDGMDNAGPVCFGYYSKSEFYFTPEDDNVRDQWFTQDDHTWNQVPTRDLCGARNGAIGTYRVQAW